MRVALLALLSLSASRVAALHASLPSALLSSRVAALRLHASSPAALSASHVSARRPSAFSAASRASSAVRAARSTDAEDTDGADGAAAAALAAPADLALGGARAGAFLRLTGVMFAAGGALGPWLDNYHSAFGVLRYTRPAVVTPLLTTDWWVGPVYFLGI